MSPTPTEWLTPEQSTEGTPYTAAWLRARLREGVIEGSRVRGRWLVTREAIDAYIRSQTNSTAQPQGSRPRRRRQMRKA